jgi:hypothetical protein
MTTSTHYLYLSASGLIVLSDDGQGLRQGASFDASFVADDKGLSTHLALRSWLLECRRDTFVLIVDVSEEEFLIELIPNLGRRDLLTVIKRRISQRFREARLLHWTIPQQIGRKVFAHGKSSNAQVRVQIGGVPRDDLMHAWLSVIEQSKVALRSVVSPALLAHRCLPHHLNEDCAMIVSWSPAGLRQTVIFKGEIRFTRLAAQLPSVDLSAVQTECLRTIQYLLMTQQISRDDLRTNGLPIWILEGGIAGLERTPNHLAVDTSVEVSLGVIPALTLGSQAMAAMGALPSWCATESFPPLPSSQRHGYADERLRRGHLVRSMERWLFRTGAFVSSCAVICLVASLSVKAFWPAESQALLLKAQRTLGAKENLSKELSRFSIAGPEMQSVVEVAQGLRKRHVDAFLLMQSLSIALEEDKGLDLQTLRWRRLEPHQSTQWTTFDLAAKTEQVGDNMLAKNESSIVSQPLAPLSAIPLGSGSSGPLAFGHASPLSTPGAAGAVARSNEHSPSNLGPVVLEIKGSLTGQPLMQEANLQTKQFAQRIRNQCSCEVVVSNLPFDPEASRSYSKSFEARAEGDNSQPKFTIRALFTDLPDVAQMVHRSRFNPKSKTFQRG